MDTRKGAPSAGPVLRLEASARLATRRGNTMRHLLFLTIAAMLGASMSPHAPADAPVPAASTESVAATSAVPDLAASVVSHADRPTCFGRRATLVGTSGDDEIFGTSKTDVIVALGGDDVVRARGGDDYVCGGPGDDRLVGGKSGNRPYPLGGDRLSGDEGDDRITAKGMGGVLRGGPGDDYVATPTRPPRQVGSPDRLLYGGPGADRLVGTADDIVSGGPGPDRLMARGVSVSTFLEGGPGGDVLTTAKGGETWIELRADGDQIRIRSERAGSYVLMYAPHIPEPIEVDLAAGTIRRVGAATGDVITHLTPVPTVIDVSGTFYDDRMSGTDNADILGGLFGNDILSGRGGDDFLDGSDGDDVLDGGDGKDEADGGPGRDTCVNAERLIGC